MTNRTKSLPTEGLTEDQMNLKDFLEEENVIVDNIVDTSRENYFEDTQEEFDDNGNQQNQQQNNQNQDFEDETEQEKEARLAKEAADKEAADKAAADKNKVADDDIADDELFKDFKKPEEQQQAVPKEFNSPIEIASYLGVKIDGKKPEEITFEDVKKEIENTRKLATESDLTEIKNIKSFLAENKGATEIDYFQKYVSPIEPLLYYGDKELMMYKFTELDKKSLDEAEKLVDDLIYEKKFEDTVKNFRSFVSTKNAEFYTKRDSEFENAKKEREQATLKNREDLMRALHENKSSFFDGNIVLKNSEILDMHKGIVNGEVHKALKDHKVMGEVYWFLKNKLKLIQILKGDGANDARLNLFNQFANAKQPQMRGAAPSSADELKVDPNDWN